MGKTLSGTITDEHSVSDSGIVSPKMIFTLPASIYGSSQHFFHTPVTLVYPGIKKKSVVQTSHENNTVMASVIAIFMTLLGGFTAISPSEILLQLLSLVCYRKYFTKIAILYR